MTKFSVGGESPEEDEGPSNQAIFKRQKICVGSGTSFSLHPTITEQREERRDGSREGAVQEEVRGEELALGRAGGVENDGEERVEEEEYVYQSGGDEGEEIDELPFVDSATDLSLSPVDSSDRRRFQRHCFPSVFLTDPEVLDCSICFNQLSIPVFQCDNGHIACSTCCTKLNNKCPSCSRPIGFIRCRAIEKVLESAKVSCRHAKYGCKNSVGYGKDDDDHEKSCMYAPCVCPILSCCLVGSWKQLSRHMSNTHPNSTVRFSFNTMFTISICLRTCDKFVFLQEENNGALFVLSNHMDRNGNAVKLSCLRPTSCKEEFIYDLLVKMKGTTLHFQSVTKNHPVWLDYFPSNGFLFIHQGLFDSSEQTTLELHVWENGVLPPEQIQKRVWV